MSETKKITPKKKAAPKKEEAKKVTPNKEEPKKAPAPKAEDKPKAAPKLKTTGELLKAFATEAGGKDAATKAKLKVQLKKDLAALKNK
mgnify:FL=1|jgi:hypothetical protein